ncbi:RloB family protein [Cellulomonas triticagri]|uniref:RloB domain-containing protein n=1 Tax=Cellulomonas triticagri TaxID=2483352 RepID=A0A3M2IRM2_9CELL|nr:RloB family protein [Cellulomonas triticagri]RMI04597.1 RloB domain-containing protein [Cellulomonas triticagri]
MGRQHRPPRSTARGAPRREPGRRFLVVCEGQTEKAYFTYVQRVLREGVTVQAVVGKRSDAVAVVSQAAKARESRADFDEVWAVVDHDGRTARVEEARALAAKRGVRLALSNPSFEVWLVWHLREFSLSCDQKAVEAALSAACEQGYIKGTQADFAPYAGRMGEALARARAQRERHARDGIQFPLDRPSTDVDVLMGGIVDSVTRRRARADIAL